MLFFFVDGFKERGFFRICVCLDRGWGFFKANETICDPFWIFDAVEPFEGLEV